MELHSKGARTRLCGHCTCSGACESTPATAISIGEGSEVLLVMPMPFTGASHRTRDFLEWAEKHTHEEEKLCVLRQ
jgi:hypothetical protein